MKILIDSSITQNDKWFKSFPVIINGKEDTNDYKKIKSIIRHENNKTAFLSFEKLKKNYNLNNSEKCIIFTIPKSMSSQYDNYVIQNKFKNTIIIEGTAFFTKKDQVRKIIMASNNLEEIKKKIDALNKTINMTGVILNIKTLNLNGRLNSLFALLIKSSNIKIKIAWKNGKWSKEKVSLSGISLIKKYIKDKEKINIISSGIENSKSEKVIKKIKEAYPNIKIKQHPMTNSMIAHSGQDFIVMY